MPTSFGAGASPDQLLQFGNLMQQARGRQLEERSLDIQEEQNRISNKMALIQQQTDTILNKKKLEVEKQRANAYDRMVQAQEMQAMTAARQAQAEMEQLQRKENFIANMSSVNVDTNAGKMPLSLAMTVADMGGKDAGFEITEDNWKKIGSITTPEGETVYQMLNPKTGEMRDVASTAMTASEDIEDKIDDAAKVSSKLLGESQLAGLKSDVQYEAADSNVLSAVIGRENPNLASSTIGTKAFQANKQYYEAISKATRARDLDEVKKQVRTILGLRDKMIKRAFKAQVPPDTFEFSTYDIETLERRLIDSGMDPKMVETVVGQASQEFMSNQGGNNAK